MKKEQDLHIIYLEVVENEVIKKEQRINYLEYMKKTKRNRKEEDRDSYK